MDKLGKWLNYNYLAKYQPKLIHGDSYRRIYNLDSPDFFSQIHAISGGMVSFHYVAGHNFPADMLNTHGIIFHRVKPDISILVSSFLHSLSMF